MMPHSFLALVCSEGKRLLRSRLTYALIAIASVLMFATILSSPDEQRALLFMVAGNDPNRVGGSIGFIGNLVDAGDIAGSAARTSLVFTVLWIPLVSIYAVITASQDYTSASYDVSKARGVTDIHLVLAKCTVQGALCSLAYVVSCGASFMFKLIQYGGTLSFESAVRYAVPAVLAAVLLVSVFIETFALYQVTRSTVAASVIAVVLSFFIMAWYPSAYGGGMGAGGLLVYLSPVFYLMNVCALCFQTVETGTVLAYVALAVSAALLVSSCALKAREVLR